MFGKQKQYTLEVRDVEFSIKKEFIVTLAIDGKLQKFVGSGYHWYHWETVVGERVPVKNVQIVNFLSKWWSKKITSIVYELIGSDIAVDKSFPTNWNSINGIKGVI